MGFLLIGSSRLQAAGKKEEFDYNFDGHMDYRVLTGPDEKASTFDIFIYDPKHVKDVKDVVLSNSPVTPHHSKSPLLKKT